MNETIKRLKELRAKATQGEWRKLDVEGVLCHDRSDELGVGDAVTNFQESDATLACALVNSLPDLLTYIEELEKKVEAGKVLAEAGKRLRIGLNIIGYSKKLGELRSEYDTASDTYNKAIK